jgi:hypothetical protein
MKTCLERVTHDTLGHNEAREMIEARLWLCESCDPPLLLRPGNVVSAPLFVVYEFRPSKLH